MQLRDDHDFKQFLIRTELGKPILDRAARTNVEPMVGVGPQPGTVAAGAEASTAWRLDAQLIPIDLVVAAPAYSPPEQQLLFPVRAQLLWLHAVAEPSGTAWGRQ